MTESNAKKRQDKAAKTDRSQLTVEELEERLAPSAPAKKTPTPPPYPAGADYGLVKRDNLSW